MQPHAGVAGPTAGHTVLQPQDVEKAKQQLAAITANLQGTLDIAALDGLLDQAAKAAAAGSGLRTSDREQPGGRRTRSRSREERERILGKATGELFNAELENMLAKYIDGDAAGKCAKEIFEAGKEKKEL